MKINFGVGAILAFIVAFAPMAISQTGGGGSNGGPCTEPGVTFLMSRMWGSAVNNSPKPPWPEWDGACSYTMDPMTEFHEETVPVGANDLRTYRVKVLNFLEEYHNVMGDTQLYQMNVNFDYEKEFTVTMPDDAEIAWEGNFKEIYSYFTGGVKNGVQSDSYNMVTTFDANGADPWIQSGLDATYEELYQVVVVIGAPVAYIESHTNDREGYTNYDGGESKKEDFDFLSSRARDQITKVMAPGHWSKLAKKKYYDPDDIGGLKNKVEQKIGNIGPWRLSNISALAEKVETTVDYRSNGRRSGATVVVDAGGVESTLSVEWADVAMAPPINITLDGVGKTEAEANAWLTGTAVPAAAAFHISGCPFLAGSVQGLGVE